MKLTKKNNKNKKKSLTQKYNIAGKVIGSGGFGCIFKPQLKCKKNKYKYDKKGISKLMKNRYVKEELREINLIKKLTKTIKNRNKYFLLDNVYSCKPKSIGGGEMEKVFHMEGSFK